MLRPSLARIAICAFVAFALAPTSSRAGEQVAIGTIQVRLANGTSQTFAAASADRAWLETWTHRPVERRDVVLQGRAAGASGVATFHFQGCTLGGVHAAAGNYDWVDLGCETLLRTD